MSRSFGWKIVRMRFGEQNRKLYWKLFLKLLMEIYTDPFDFWRNNWKKHRLERIEKEWAGVANESGSRRLMNFYRFYLRLLSYRLEFSRCTNDEAATLPLSLNYSGKEMSMLAEPKSEFGRISNICRGEFNLIFFILLERRCSKTCRQCLENWIIRIIAGLTQMLNHPSVSSVIEIMYMICVTRVHLRLGWARSEWWKESIAM